MCGACALFLVVASEFVVRVYTKNTLERDIFEKTHFLLNTNVMKVFVSVENYCHRRFSLEKSIYANIKSIANMKTDRQ